MLPSVRDLVKRCPVCNLRNSILWILASSLLYSLVYFMFPLSSDVQKILMAFFLIGGLTLSFAYFQRRKAEEALRKASGYARNLIETSLDPLVTISVEGKITDVNKATEKITGVERNELIGSDFANYFTEPETARAGYLKVFADGQVTDYSLAIRHVSGSVADVLYNASVYRDEQGMVLGVFAAARDVTARKQAEDSLHKSEKVLREAQRVAQIGSWHWDAVNDIIWWSEELYKIYQKNPEVYQKDRQNYTPESTARLDAVVQKALKTGESYIIDLELNRADGVRRWVQAIGEAVRSDSGQIVALQGTVQNITERKRAEEELKRIQEMLIQSEKMAAVGMLSAGVAHELNNPLTGILGVSRYYMARKDPQDAEYSDFREIITAGERMAKIIKGLLMFSRPSTGERETLNCNDIISTVLDIGEKTIIGKDVIVHKELADGLPMVSVDRNQIEQVMINLMSNSVDAMHKKGVLKLVSRLIAIEDTAFVEMELTDNGNGISKDEITKIFNPFFTTKRPGKGTGLGLTIAFSIIKDHHGEILVESPPSGQEQGTSFKVRLPAARQQKN